MIRHLAPQTAIQGHMQEKSKIYKLINYIVRKTFLTGTKKIILGENDSILRATLRKPLQISIILRKTGLMVETI
jgi:hypothetical protein